MSDMKKKALVLRDFTDAGTGESFVTGDTPPIGVGAFANYEAAGLVQAASRATAPPRPTAKKRTRVAVKPATDIVTDPVA